MTAERPMATSCGAKNRKGGPCEQPAGWGTDHAGYGRCRFHGGSSPNGRANGAKLRVAALVPSPTTGFDAIERGLAFFNGLVDALEAELAKVDDPLMDGPLLHATVKLAKEAARDLTTVGEIAARAGLDERRLRLEEDKLTLLASTLRAVFADPELGLTAAAQDVAARVTARHLRQIEAGR